MNDQSTFHFMSNPDWESDSYAQIRTIPLGWDTSAFAPASAAGGVESPAERVSSAQEADSE